MGDSVTVLVDDVSDEAVFARSAAAEAPEVDGVVVIENVDNFVSGDFV